MRIALSLGGGGLKIAFLIGVVLELIRRGHTIVSSDGVSAGALVTALLIQNDLHVLRAVVFGDPDSPQDRRFPALTDDVHRLKTGWELGWPMIRKGPEGVDTIARNDRLWSGYLLSFVDARNAVIPGFVGAVEWNTPGCPYRSIPHTDSHWPEAVYGSATMPPPLWDAVPWRDGIELVDGGLRSTVPVDDTMRRIADGEQEPPDLVLAVPTSRDGHDPNAAGGLANNLLRAIGILSDQVGRDDVEPKTWWPDVRYRILRPSIGLGDVLESSRELQTRRFDHGRARVGELAESLRAA